MSAASGNRAKPGRAVATLAIAMLIGTAACMGPVVVPREDAAITDDVRARLAADAQTKPFAITVDTKAGNVHVAGDVRNDAERNSVARIAADTPGVRSVDNDVRFGSVPAPVAPDAR